MLNYDIDINGQTLHILIQQSKRLEQAQDFLEQNIVIKVWRCKHTSLIDKKVKNAIFHFCSKKNSTII